ncbi:unnamed protein product [Parnassius apollo]|uniref:protein kinase C n=1 Tax=Parnassius apollo TaxID=110799 RepID=A0A8S3XNJ7_PARAO|nr:unnamed protein product [Parnassius apollo]
MYYSGTPSYISSPYSYSSSFTPLGTSYSASYLNPGASYSNHSSLGGYSRTPITTRWISSGRSYSPMLSTISERGSSTPVRINSPRRAPIPNRITRTYVSASYTPRPVNINTADIDVSQDKYRNKKQNSDDTSLQSQTENLSVEEDKCPLEPRVEDKPKTGIDTSPGVQKGAIKRERTVVRLHTLKRKERDSPRKPVEELQKRSDNIKKEVILSENNNKENSVETKRWREKLSEDLIYKDTREKKSLGAKLVEKFQVKDKDNDSDNNKNIANRCESTVLIPSQQPNIKVNNKSPDRRCSMELLAEQASLLDSLIRRENLSTASLDLSKVGTNVSNLNNNLNNNINNLNNNINNVDVETSKKFKLPEQNLPITSTKSDHSLHDRLNTLKDQKHTSTRRSIKKSSSGSNIPKLDAITEFPKQLSQNVLPIIEESRQSVKDGNIIESKTKPVLKAKITSTVEITPPSSPLRFKVENITVEEKPRIQKKEICFSSIVENNNYSQLVKTKKNNTIVSDPVSPEPEDGNFWNKIGKRETVYIKSRKQTLEEAKENQQHALFWFPEEECKEHSIININIKNISKDEEKQTNKTEVYSEQENIYTRNDDKEKCLENTLQPNSQTNSKTPQSDISTKSSVNTQSSLDIKTKPTNNETVLNKGTKELFEVKQGTFEKNKQNVTEDSQASELETIKQSFKQKITSNTILQNNKLNNENLSIISSDNKSCIGSMHRNMIEERKDKQFSSNDKLKNIKKMSLKQDDEITEDIISISKQIDKDSTENVINEATSNLASGANRQSESDTQICIEKGTEKSKPDKLILNEHIPISKNNEILHELISKDNNNNTNMENNVLNMVNTETDGVAFNKLNTMELCKFETTENILVLRENSDSCINSEDNNKDKNSVSMMLSKTQNIPNNNTECNLLNEEELKANSGYNNVTLQKDKKQHIKQPSINKLLNPKPAKPVKEQMALKPLIATPRPLQKKVPQLIHSSSSSSSETTSDEETSDEEGDVSNSSDGSGEFYECDNNPDGRTSTGSNDSGFDSSASTSPAGFNCVRKDCDVNCHRKCEKLTANLCGVNQRLLVEALAFRTASKRGGDCPSTSAGNVPAQALGTDILERGLEQSTAYGLFRKTGRFTPPARSIPRFRKYNIEDFQFIKVLGKGSFGKVLLAELRDTEYYYAVKCLKKDVVLEDDDVECTLIERKVLALGTNHPYLCHLFATFQTDSHLFFVMEYLNGGDLMFHIQQSGRFPEPRARFYAAEIVSGLKFLHKRGIIYRDLKLDNILLDFDGHVRIADFGMCKLQIYLDKTADTFCGTPDYMAPEIIKGLKYNQTVDWWSFGVLLYEMLIGQSPFSGCDEDELFWSICNEMPSYPRFLSQESLSILTRLLDKDARTRLGGAECMHGDIRDQDFFHAVAWDRLERRELEAPFKPKVRHPLDTQYFDKAFTGERPRLTAVEPHVLRSMDQEPFRGFSYTNPNATDR